MRPLPRFRKKNPWCVLVATLLIGLTSTIMAAPGAYTPVPADGEEVLVAAGFAVAEQERRMSGTAGSEPVRLELVGILGAERQVVSGMQYRLNLEVVENGASKQAEAVVWWQAWREPDPYQLTSWQWVNLQDGN